MIYNYITVELSQTRFNKWNFLVILMSFGEQNEWLEGWGVSGSTY